MREKKLYDHVIENGLKQFFNVPGNALRFQS